MASSSRVSVWNSRYFPFSYRQYTKRFRRIFFPSSGGGSYTLPPATADTLGGIKVGSGLSINDGVLSADGITPAAVQADSTATTVAALKDDLNALLAKLKTAGLMAAE